MTAHNAGLLPLSYHAALAAACVAHFLVQVVFLIKKHAIDNTNIGIYAIHYSVSQAFLLYLLAGVVVQYAHVLLKTTSITTSLTDEAALAILRGAIGTATTMLARTMIF